MYKMLDAIHTILARYYPSCTQSENMVSRRHETCLSWDVSAFKQLIEKCAEPFIRNPQQKPFVIKQGDDFFYVVIKEKSNTPHLCIYHRTKKITGNGKYNNVYHGIKVHTGKPCAIKVPRPYKISSKNEKKEEKENRNEESIRNPLHAKQDWEQKRNAELVKENQNILDMCNKIAGAEGLKALLPKVNGHAYVPFMQSYASFKIENQQISILEKGQKTLSQLIKEGQMDENHVDEYADQLLNILQLLEAMEIILMDVKPGNIMLFGECLKLIDLGETYLLPPNNEQLYTQTLHPVRSLSYLSISARENLKQAKTNADMRKAQIAWMRTNFAYTLFELYHHKETARAIAEAKKSRLQDSILFQKLTPARQTILHNLLS